MGTYPGKGSDNRVPKGRPSKNPTPTDTTSAKKTGQQMNKLRNDKLPKNLPKGKGK